MLVTTKPPTWRDPLLPWREQPLSVGTPHEGFLYPDPLGFWTEVRRWIVLLLRAEEPSWDASEALGVAALVHVGADPAALDVAMTTCRPQVVLFLDEPAWRAAGWQVDARPHHIPDPHRAGQVYQGFWGRAVDASGRAIEVGKAPQHPSTHRLYRREDMDGFLLDRIPRARTTRPTRRTRSVTTHRGDTD